MGPFDVDPEEIIDPKETVETFSSQPHPHSVWRLLQCYLGDNPSIEGLIACLAAGVTETNELARVLGLSIETVEVRKAQLHRAVRSLESDIEQNTGIQNGLTNPRDAELLDTLQRRCSELSAP